MSDPLSVAGSIVGIAAAGFKISTSLYALAETVITASDRVESIANDVSSTCGFLNQLRDLITPQAGPNGTHTTIFNTAALSDISEAATHCSSIFGQISRYLQRANKQLGTNSRRGNAKIELSKLDKAKWPFLQPQFNEMRNDLRDSKLNLLLMMTVARLATAQRKGQGRQIEEHEKIEMKALIVQLQKATTSETRKLKQTYDNEDEPSEKDSDENANIPHPTLKTSGPNLALFKRRNGPKEEQSRSLAKGKSVDTIDEDETLPGEKYRTLRNPNPLDFTTQKDSSTHVNINLTRGTVPVTSGNDRSVDPPGKIPTKPPKFDDNTNNTPASQWVISSSRKVDGEDDEKQMQLIDALHSSDGAKDDSMNEENDKGTKPASIRTREPGSSSSDKQASNANQEDTKSLANSHLLTKKPSTITTRTSTTSSSNRSQSSYFSPFEAWVTSILPDLTTGLGQSLEILELKMDPRELNTLVERQKAESYNLFEALKKLNVYQRRLILDHLKSLGQPEVNGAMLIFVDVWGKERVQTVFGELEVVTLMWVTATGQILLDRLYDDDDDDEYHGFQEEEEFRSGGTYARKLKSGQSVDAAEENRRLAEKAEKLANAKPIMFKDCLGRNFQFPFHMVKTLDGMTKLINAAFQHDTKLKSEVEEGHYELINATTKENILRETWESIVKPGWKISMEMRSDLGAVSDRKKTSRKPRRDTLEVPSVNLPLPPPPPPPPPPPMGQKRKIYPSSRARPPPEKTERISNTDDKAPIPASVESKKPSRVKNALHKVSKVPFGLFTDLKPRRVQREEVIFDDIDLNKVPVPIVSEQEEKEDDKTADELVQALLTKWTVIDDEESVPDSSPAEQPKESDP